MIIIVLAIICGWYLCHRLFPPLREGYDPKSIAGEYYKGGMATTGGSTFLSSVPEMIISYKGWLYRTLDGRNPCAKSNFSAAFGGGPGWVQGIGGYRYCDTQFNQICEGVTGQFGSFGQPDCCRGNYNDISIPPAEFRGDGKGHTDGEPNPAWNIAPNNAESREVIWNYPWNTDYIVLADGTKWYTSGAWNPAPDAWRFRYPKSGSSPPANVMNSKVPMECVGDTECLGEGNRDDTGGRAKALGSIRYVGDPPNMARCATYYGDNITCLETMYSTDSAATSILLRTKDANPEIVTPNPCGPFTPSPPATCATSSLSCQTDYTNAKSATTYDGTQGDFESKCCTAPTCALCDGDKKQLLKVGTPCPTGGCTACCGAAPTCATSSLSCWDGATNSATATTYDGTPVDFQSKCCTGLHSPTCQTCDDGKKQLLTAGTPCPNADCTACCGAAPTCATSSNSCQRCWGNTKNSTTYDGTQTDFQSKCCKIEECCRITYDTSKIVGKAGKHTACSPNLQLAAGSSCDVACVAKYKAATGTFTCNADGTLTKAALTCTANPFCSSLLKCDKGRQFKPEYKNIQCKSGVCQDAECCEAIPQPTCQGYPCSTHHTIKANANNVTCTGANGCTDADCCVTDATPTCASDPVLCPTGYENKPNLSNITCREYACTEADCCIMRPPTPPPPDITDITKTSKIDNRKWIDNTQRIRKFNVKDVRHQTMIQSDPIYYGGGELELPWRDNDRLY